MCETKTTTTTTEQNIDSELIVNVVVISVDTDDLHWFV